MRGHVAKKGNRYYAVVYEGTDPGTGKDKYRWVAAGTRKEDADKLVNELVRQKHRGETGSDRSTLATYLTDRWLPLQEHRLRPTTFLSYSKTVELHIVPYIGRIRLDKLQPDDLEALYVKLLREGRRNGGGGGLSPASVRYVHRVIRKALGDARRKGIVARNVAAIADQPELKRQSKDDEAEEGIQVWSTDEMTSFLTATAEHKLHNLWVVAAHTGMRRGELLGLRWRNVDLDRRVISVRSAIVLAGYTIHVSEAKTATGRRNININRQIVAALDDQRRMAEESGRNPKGSDLIFGRDDGKPVHPQLISRTFDRLVAKHELPRIRFHDVRHTHATLMLKAGVHPKVVSERLGHATPGFTMNVYQHVVPGMQAEAADLFGDLLDPEC